MRTSLLLHRLALTLLLACLATPMAFGQSVVALVGDAAPDTGGGTFSSLDRPRVNDSGDVVFQATVTGGTAGSGVFVSRAGGAPEAVVVAGDAAPVGGTFTGFSRADIDNDGDIAFIANVTGGTYNSGVFLESQGQVTILIINTAEPPGAGGGTFGTFFGAPSMNDSDEVAFRASAVGGQSTQGIFIATTTSITTIFLEGDFDPGQAGTLFNFGDPSINADGDVAVTTTIVPGGGGASTTAVIATRMSLAVPIAAQGDPAPDSGGTFGTLFSGDAPVIDDSGDVFFRAGTLVGGASDNGLFVNRSGGAVEALILSGDSLPDVGAGTLDVVDPDGLAVNAAGEAIYTAVVLSGTSGSGGFATNGSATRSLVLEGDPAPASVGGSFGSFSFGPATSANGTLAFVAPVTGGSSAVGIFTVPEPAGAPIAAIAALGCLKRRRRRR